MAAVSRFVELWGARATLALGLVLCGVVGLITPYLLVAIGIALLVATSTDGSLRASFQSLEVRAFAAIWVVLALTFAATARQSHDVLFAFNFIMLVLFAGFHAALSRLRRPDASVIVARLALAGTLICLIMAILIIYVFDLGRKGYGLIGVITLSNTAVLLGFLALTGVVIERGARRLFYLLAPILGILATLITASRGPLIGVVPLALIGGIFLVRALKLRWPVVVGMIVAASLAVAAAVLVLGGRLARLPEILEAIVSGGSITDRTTVSRLDLYQGAWQAFQQSPLVGHGWAHLMDAVKPFLTNQKLARLPQLHNDIADFAVAGGVIGLACYVGLLATPIVAALRSPRDSQYGLRVYGCLVLTFSYIGGGMTDLMFGFEFHTALYAVVAAILLSYCRDGVRGST